MIGGQKISLRIFSDFPMSCANFAYRLYRIPLRTALSKKLKSPLTPICIFRGPMMILITEGLCQSIFYIDQWEKGSQTFS